MERRKEGQQEGRKEGTEGGTAGGPTGIGRSGLSRQDFLYARVPENLHPPASAGTSHTPFAHPPSMLDETPYIFIPSFLLCATAFLQLLYR